jgi:hypothetical protein
MAHEGGAPDRPRDVEPHWRDEVDRADARQRRTGRWLEWLALAGVVAALVVVPSLVQRGTVPAPNVPERPIGTTASATTTTVVPDLGPAILGVTDPWELFALGDNSLTVIQFAAGRISTTYFTPLPSTGPVFLVVGADRAVVKPLDAVPGYLVPDTGPVRKLPGLLSRAGPALPASDPNQVWVGPDDNGPSVMTLTDLTGSRVLATASLPAGAETVTAADDGAGYPLVRGVSGSYVLGPGGPQCVTTGQVVAAGPSGWLADECDEQGRCTTVDIDRATGSRRMLPLRLDGNGSPGVLSADGTFAAFVVGRQNGGTTLHLADLVTGTDHEVDVHPARGSGRTVVWSPDGRWLLVVDDTGHLRAVDPRTRVVAALPGPVPLLRQLAIRTRR